jgi:CBS domain-containing protein
MLKAADIMFTNVVSVTPAHTVQDAAELMLEHGISGLPVIDADARLVGIVSESDLMRHVEAGTEHHRSWWLRSLMGRESLAREYVKENARRIADVMTKPVLTAAPETPVYNIAEMLERNGIKRLPIVKDGRVVGIVSRANLLRALARGELTTQHRRQASDSALREAILARVDAEPWARTALINVAVTDGTVKLSGLVETTAEKNALRLAAELTEGVKAVEDATMIRPLGAL